MISEQNIVRTLYKKLLSLYPRKFKERLGESMLQTFNDLYQERQTEGRWPGFIPWMFFDTALGIVREHALLITEGAMMKNILTNPGSVALIGSILLAVAFIVAPFIYLVGNLRDAMGPFAYSMADFLSGPVWAASLVSVVFVLRERIGKQAPRRMSLALFAALLAAGTMVAVACIRSANRQYHLTHPELHLENSSEVLTVWTTLVAGMTGAGLHFFGWALVLIGSAGWTSHRLPRLLSILYLLAGINSMFVYLLPGSEGNAVVLGVIVIIWQGIMLWKTKPEEMQAAEITTSQPS